jgi:hypothetical protein
LEKDRPNNFSVALSAKVFIIDSIITQGVISVKRQPPRRDSPGELARQRDDYGTKHNRPRDPHRPSHDSGEGWEGCGLFFVKGKSLRTINRWTG